MLVAHIVPVNHLDLLKNRDYHMCLAHVVLQNKQYATFYKNQVQRGKFVIMDNGAAENESLSIKQLWEAYQIVKPTEIIMTDHVLSKDKTYESTKNAIQFFRDKNVKSRLMAVPQGTTLDEWKESANQLLDLPIDTIGVSKFLTITTNDYLAREKATEYLSRHNKLSDKHVHLLGCQAPIKYIERIGNRFKCVRGCDTALAYLFTLGRQLIYADQTRPETEIDFIDGTVENGLLDENVEMFDNFIQEQKNSFALLTDRLSPDLQYEIQMTVNNYCPVEQINYQTVLHVGYNNPRKVPIVPQLKSVIINCIDQKPYSVDTVVNKVFNIVCYNEPSDISVTAYTKGLVGLPAIVSKIRTKKEDKS